MEWVQCVIVLLNLRGSSYRIPPRISTFTEVPNWHNGCCVRDEQVTSSFSELGQILTKMATYSFFHCDPTNPPQYAKRK